MMARSTAQKRGSINAIVGVLEDCESVLRLSRSPRKSLPVVRREQARFDRLLKERLKQTCRLHFAPADQGE